MLKAGPSLIVVPLEMWRFNILHSGVETLQIIRACRQHHLAIKTIIWTTVDTIMCLLKLRRNTGSCFSLTRRHVCLVYQFII